MKTIHNKTKYMPWKAEYEQELKPRKKRAAGAANPPQLVFDLLDDVPRDSNGDILNDTSVLTFHMSSSSSNQSIINNVMKPYYIAKGSGFVANRYPNFKEKFLPAEVYEGTYFNEYNMRNLTDEDKLDMLKAGLIVDKTADVWKIDTTNFRKEHTSRYPQQHLQKQTFKGNVEHHGELTLHHDGKIHNIEDNLSAGDLIEFSVPFVGEMVNATTRSGQSTTSINTLGNQIDENVINQSHLVQYNTITGILTINLAKPLAGGIYELIINLQSSDSDNVNIGFYGTTSNWNSRREYGASTTDPQGISDKSGKFLSDMDIKQLARMSLTIYNNGTTIDTRHDFIRYPAIGTSQIDNKYYRQIGTSRHINTLDNTKPVFENAIKIEIKKLNGQVSPLINGFITFIKKVGVK